MYGAIGAVVAQHRCFSLPVFWLETWVCADNILVKYVPRSLVVQQMVATLLSSVRYTTASRRPS